VTDTYEDARVLLELASEQSKFSIYLNRDLQEQYQLQLTKTDKRRGWSVDLTMVHFLEYRHPKITSWESLERLSAFTALETLNQISKICTDMSSRTGRMAVESIENGPSFVIYAEPELHHLQARSSRILRHLGFQPGTLDRYKFAASDKCPTYMVKGHASDFPVLELPSNEDCPNHEQGERNTRLYQPRFGKH
jgi:hypothetical protein